MGFLLCDHGAGFLEIGICENSINQSSPAPAAPRPGRDRTRGYEERLEDRGVGGGTTLSGRSWCDLVSQRRADDNGGAIPAKPTSRTVRSNSNGEQETGAPSRKAE